MTFNIHHAEGTDGQIDVQRIAKVINESGADLVALQEVDRGVERTKKTDMMTTLSDLTGLTYAFGKNIDFQGGDYGNGVLTRFPIVSEKNLHYHMVRQGEQRGLLQLVLDIRGQEIVFMNTHLDYRSDDEERINNITEINLAASSYENRPVIVCGDFNDTTGSKTIASMNIEFDDSWDLAGSGPGYTFSATQPLKRIDYIFVKKNKSDTTLSPLRPVAAKVSSSTASDHLPLVVEFRLKPGI